MLDLLATLSRALFYTAAALLMLLCLPFVVCHVADHWNAPEYPHCGFTPDCPTWEAPENTLPPTEDDLATRCTPARSSF